MQAFEQRGGSFVGKVRQLAFVGECGNFAGNLRQLFNAHTAWFHECSAANWLRAFGQVVRFVDAIETVFRVGQNDTAAHADVDHQQIVVGDDDIDGFQRVAGKVKQAFRAVGAGGFEAAVVVVVHLHPDGVVDFSGQVSRSPLNRRAENSSAMSRNSFNSSGLGLLSHNTAGLQSRAGFTGRCFA